MGNKQSQQTELSDENLKTVEEVVLGEAKHRSRMEKEALDAFRTLTHGSDYPCSAAFLEKHCLRQNPTLLLLIIDGDVYDATVFAPSHKAGVGVIRKNAGKECGEVFRRIHGLKAKEQLKTMRVGTLIGGGDGGGGETSQKSSNLLSAGYASSGAKRAVVKPPPAPPKKEGFVVTEVAAVSPTTRRLTFASPDELPLAPGGHVMITDDNGAAARNYTPYSVSPTSFSILVKQYPGGAVSSYLHSLKAGQFVEVSPPLDPTFDVRSIAAGTRIMLVSGGTGVAPLYSMSRYLCEHAAEQKLKMTFFACFRDEEDVLLGEELSELAQETPAGAMQLYFVFSRVDISRFQDQVALTGRFSAQHIESTIDSADLVIVCGPPNFDGSVQLASLACQATKNAKFVFL